MVASNPSSGGTEKSRRRTDHAGEPAPVAVQIAGADPAMMADAARYNVERGAQIIDINMGCPAKKVCNAAAGSALLADEPLVAPDPRGRGRAPSTCRSRSRFAPARIRARATRCASRASPRPPAFRRSRCTAARAPARSSARSNTTRSRRSSRRCAIPGHRQRRHRLAGAGARRCSQHTGADAIMIGRAAQGRPWIFREIAHFLAAGLHLPPPTVAEARALIVEHLADHYAFYGEETGVRTARKHLGWYTAGARRRRGVSPRDVSCGNDRWRSSPRWSDYFDRLAGEVRPAALPAAGRCAGARRIPRVDSNHNDQQAVGNGGTRGVNRKHRLNGSNDICRSVDSRSTNTSSGSTGKCPPASTTW